MINAFFLSLFVNLLLFHTAYSATTINPSICFTIYVLCTDAQCQPIPGMDNKALCSCDVNYGYNAGFSTCAARNPIKKNDRTALLSEYSFDRLSVQSVMTCPSGIAWASCLDQPCYVDSHDPKHATCTCDLIRTGVYITQGGSCNLNTCSTIIWSAALANDPNVTAMQQGLMKKLGLSSLPSTTLCPIANGMPE